MYILFSLATTSVTTIQLSCSNCIEIVEGIRSNCVDGDSLANGKLCLPGGESCIDVDRSVRVITGIVRGFADLNSAPYSYCSVVGLCTPCKYGDSGRYKK